MTKLYLIAGWAERKGQPVEAECPDAPTDGSVYFKPDGHAFPSFFYLGKDAFLTEAEAVAAIEKARLAKIASLKKQLAKLEKLAPLVKP